MKQGIIRASAPGKLILAGEYAVLDHAPALVTAVSTRARCEFNADADSKQLRILARPLSDQPRRAILGEELHWEDADVPLFSAAFSALSSERRAALAGAGGDLLMDSSAFFVKETKLGLGSSAAMLTALMGVLWELSGGLPDEPEAFEALRVAHTLFQGSGSGADLAASLVGGTLLFRRDPAIRAPVSLPESIEIIPAWTGNAASTPKFLERLAAFEKDHHEDFLARFKVLEQEAEEVAMAAAEGNAEALLEALGDFSAGLKALGEAADMPIWGEAQRAIAAAVAAE
ncbi:MAG: hypothetical protein R3217_04420, partial [Gammaproteobacteria bacterium]|nr:hypothetical protein [Gammaproteobacteria bacterium]